MRTIKAKCSWCGKEFEKEVRYYTRSVKENTGHCCSRSCSAKFGNKMKPHHGGDISKYCGNKRDQYTPFRWFMVGTKWRAKNGNQKRNKDCNVDVKYLAEVWNNQNGVCPYTGWKLLLPKSSEGFDDGTERVKRASLDRIDNNMGYVKGNVQFVSMMANYAKNNFTDEELICFCNAVYENHN